MFAARKSNYLSLWTSVLPDLATDHSEQYEKWYSFNSISVDKPLNKFPSLVLQEKKLYNFKKSSCRISKY